jgi:anthranilate phosphoribosyltransferase
MIREGIAKVVSGVDLNEQEMILVMHEIMGGEATPAQIAAFITALRMKGETIDEIVGAARVMRDKATKIPLGRAEGAPGLSAGHDVLIDTCGTGGDGSMTFNISTTTAFVVAGGGVKVAKHGNRSVSSSCGSADVLEKLGVPVEASPETVARNIQTIGIGFLFAPAFHSSMRHAVGPRREVGIRTIFNILGPLTNPASAPFQLLGVYSEDLCEVLARVLLRLGTKRAMVVHGADGMDEISVTAETKVSEIRDGDVFSYSLHPGDFGFQQYEMGALRGGDPQENARTLRGIIAGHDHGARRSVVVLNAGAAFYIAGVCKDIRDGSRYAEEVIDSGKALEKLVQLVEAGGQ